MSLVGHLRASTRTLFGHAAVEAELDEELAAYVELLVAEKVRAGASPTTPSVPYSSRSEESTW